MIYRNMRNRRAPLLPGTESTTDAGEEQARRERAFRIVHRCTSPVEGLAGGDGPGVVALLST